MVSYRKDFLFAKMAYYKIKKSLPVSTTYSLLLLEKTTPEPNLTCGWLIYLSICLTTRNEGNLFGQYLEFIFRKTKKNQIKG
jgi:hypothetical protein